MNNSGWYTTQELHNFGINKIGKNVYISNKVSIYGGKNIEIGDNVRIDDFCVLAANGGKLVFYGYNHIAAFCYINSAGGVEFGEFAGLSSRCSLYSASDNYDGSCLTNPTVPENYLSVKKSPIVLKKHVIIGTNSVVLPGCTLEQGVAVGANSLVNKSLPEFVIAVGNPAKPIKDRKKDLINLEKELKGA
jgi:galactoside O-acetyltransferase